ncbi:alpha-glucan phosphorylase [Geotalea uraniireducens]|uniref:Alpha-glucan phosphorylase n=1 Tax=Geotalea uraniireducens TaxID=351604 RepID=A0ABN6VTQ3_9BACT|nr:alpha-glucan family phosphorylase [Geotalea uraniireducens]BDV42206.1 alpha-glucan phosphorylase [Geotalea uraniireducens]
MARRRGDNPVYALLPVELDGFDELAELALDIRWSWDHGTDELWRELDPVLWELTRNPWVVLQTVARDRLQQVLADPGFRRRVDGFVKNGRRELAGTSWFRHRHGDGPLGTVAYFSMEFMLSEALPIYSGGLGNVAGDQLKAASDLGVPVIGIGLLYQQGYFRQAIDSSGMQQALFPYNDPGQLPITPLREPNGEWLRLELRLPGYSVWLRAWQVTIGRVRLYLLDSNDPANLPAHRGITSELYGGGAELRLMQELVLGIGGWRLLRALGINPEVCHLNEGHAAFAVLERARSFMKETGQPFEVALAVIRAGNLFTTHTPVPAGFDRFSPALIEQYLGTYARERLGIPFAELLALGRVRADDPAEPFNMACLAIRGSGAVNGVSRLHGAVSRRIFTPLFPRWPVAEVPVGHVTNGIHVPTWHSPAADALWTDVCGKERWLQATESLEETMRPISDAAFWQLRATARTALVELIRSRQVRQLASTGAAVAEIDAARNLFDANILTLGFARRFATYKRPNLLLHDPERLLRLLTDPQRPVQLVVAGKAHPADRAGQEMIRQWVEFVRRPEARRRVVFLSDYDMFLTQRLVQGVDVWLNTPRRPWEACGTSGMKVLANGGLNLSELDGWWAEAYCPEVGWALGDGREHGDDPAWDAAEAEELYRLLEEEVVPAFYRRDRDGIPTDWVARVRESIARLTPQFSANRTVREYTDRYYLPAAAEYRRRAADGGAAGAAQVDWRRALERDWAKLRFGELQITTTDGEHEFTLQVYLDGLAPEGVTVELYADGVDGGAPERLAMTRGPQLVGAANGYLYAIRLPAARPAADYTPRVVPALPGVAVPLEVGAVCWQR